MYSVLLKVKSKIISNGFKANHNYSCTKKLLLVNKKLPASILVTLTNKDEKGQQSNTFFKTLLAAEVGSTLRTKTPFIQKQIIEFKHARACVSMRQNQFIKNTGYKVDYFNYTIHVKKSNMLNRKAPFYNLTPTRAQRNYKD